MCCLFIGRLNGLKVEAIMIHILPSNAKVDYFSLGRPSYKEIRNLVFAIYCAMGNFR